ncbi:unnamed protein product [Rotaria sp. Silwood1]|nr:unnamed protein product [Rotaria sp. Silwood1]
MRLNDDLFKPKSLSKNTDSFSADWEVIDRKTPTKEFESSGRHSSSYSNYGSSTANSAGYSSSSKSTTQSFTSYSEANGGDAQKHFFNAKAILSDQFFNKDSDVPM